MFEKKSNKVKLMAVLLCMALLIGGVVGGTVAYLMTKTEPVTNTFTSGDVTISLLETPITYDETGAWTYGTLTANVNNEYKLIPGVTYTKDPVVSVAAGSEKCYLFVKIVEGTDNGTYLTYTLKTTGWTQLENEGTAVPGVYYRVVEKNATERSWNLIEGDKITVKSGLTKDKTNETGIAGKNLGITITAYAIQYIKGGDAANAGFKAYDAWTQVSSLG